MPYLFFFILLFNLSLFAIDIDEHSSDLPLLHQSSIFIDESSSLTLDDVKMKKFIKNNKKFIVFGYIPNHTPWIKFTLTNISNKNIEKILEYDNKEAETIIIYDGNRTMKGGMVYITKKQKSLTPSFRLSFEAHESRTFYIKIYSKNKPLRGQFTLWKEVDFITYDLEDKIYRFSLLSMIFVLFIYNLFILIFTKDKAYLYYVGYLISLIVIMLYYSGLLSLYIISPEWTRILLKAHASVIIIFMTFAILFTQEFLELKQFKLLNRLLTWGNYSLPIVAFLSYDNWFIPKYAGFYFLLIGILIIFSGFYALIKNIPQARYYVFGWSIILLGIALYSLEVLGVYYLKENHLSYVAETSFVLEALLFSIALAHRIDITNQEKSLSDKKFIAFQQEEKYRLESLVSKKTHDLACTIEAKELLYKELNHRIKNNFMMIISLLKLQISRSKLEETKESLKITQNRIKSISNLYEMLLLNREEINIDTVHYLQKIYNNITMGFPQKVKINYHISHSLDVNQLIYVGLVFNELITNSFKYAFNEDDMGIIDATLYSNDKKIFFIIKDNGKGFKERRKNSLGLTIVESLVEGQLQGQLSIDSTKGTTIFMNWKLNID